MPCIFLHAHSQIIYYYVSFISMGSFISKKWRLGTFGQTGWFLYTPNSVWWGESIITTVLTTWLVTEHACRFDGHGAVNGGYVTFPTIRHICLPPCTLHVSIPHRHCTHICFRGAKNHATFVTLPINYSKIFYLKAVILILR